LTGDAALKDSLKGTASHKLRVRGLGGFHPTKRRKPHERLHQEAIAKRGLIKLKTFIIGGCKLVPKSHHSDYKEIILRQRSLSQPPNLKIFRATDFKKINH